MNLILEVESQHQDYQNAFSPPPPLPGQPSVFDHDGTPSARPQYTPDGNRYYAAPPFLPQNTAQLTTSEQDTPSLPFHWVEVGNLLLDSASDDLVDPDQIRRLLKDLREVRMAKMRSGVDVLDAAATGGGGIALTGVGSMELGEERGFVTGVVDGLRYVKPSYWAWILIADLLKGESGLPRSRLGANKWPSKERMADMMEHKMTTRKRTIWSSKWLTIFLFRVFGVKRCIWDADSCLPTRLSCI